MNNQQQPACVPRRALFAIVALTAAGIWLGPDPSTWSDSDVPGPDPETTVPSLAHGQARPEISETSLDPRRDGRPLPRTRDSFNPSPAPHSENRIMVKFKKASRMTSGVQPNNSWVSPPIQVQQNVAARIEARAFLLDGNGTPTSAIPEWTSTNQEIVTVTTGDDDNTVLLTVYLPGETHLRISCLGTSTLLKMRATANGDVIRVDINQ